MHRKVVLHSTKGDVWSFGIFGYEVFTLGGIPYFEFTDKARQVVQAVLAVDRLPRPDNCFDQV